ncbi:hypothetical protein [Tenggerimyces flavus]|uniref:Adenosine deaminase domain-containing protein n=1 Tax=Tenggerimyces flavus TaxID=1708749 RepID=A0ABV7Y6I4_9ACTN|nr:hypothetical protein [Tenggerimyces flavus]MBM7791094.1 adenosine deaminase [Tenggerimyces flavus]
MLAWTSCTRHTTRRPRGPSATAAPSYRRAERIAPAGLGITAHAGELSPANIGGAAARMPGLTRIGHGIHAATDPALKEGLAPK